jgi:outer membrane biosynthesis protein TonB
MGRWAEVYFTSAPEKREEAVLELLRELEARKSDNILPESEAASSARFETPSGTVEGGEGDQRSCPTCGHDNPSKHQFCGMCGSQLGGTAREQLSPTLTSDRDVAEKELAGSPAQPIDEEMVEPLEAPSDLPLFQSLMAAEPSGEFDYDGSPSVRYRYYIGAVLGILILVLGYLAWRGAQTSPSAQATPPPPAPTESATPASSTAPVSAPAPAPHAVAPQPAPATTNSAELTAPKSAEIPKPVKATGAAEHTLPSSAAQPAASNDGHESSAGNGAEEYATAQRYLNSQPRDSAQAAKWLWKAMAKHNGPATLALADLYLKGEGVSKNCDQARVLLDSAARRDMAGAGERLRNLQAFGCQ